MKLLTCIPVDIPRHHPKVVTVFLWLSITKEACVWLRQSDIEGVDVRALWGQNDYAAGGRVMDGASGHLRLMGRDCSRPSPQASFYLCLIKLNYSACPRQTQLFIIIISIFNLVRKMAKWEFAMVDLSTLHWQAKHNAEHYLSHSLSVLTLFNIIATAHTQLHNIFNYIPP